MTVSILVAIRPRSTNVALRASSWHRLLTYARDRGHSQPLHGDDRRTARDLRDGAAVRRRADSPQRRALRPRGRVPGSDRRADEGARPVRGHDPGGVRRDGAGSDDLRDDRRGAQPGLDQHLRDRQHAFHRLIPADEVRYRGAAPEVPAADGDRRAACRVQPERARAGIGRRRDQDLGAQAGRRKLRDQRHQDVGHQRVACRARVRARAHRPAGRAQAPRPDLLHRRKGARGGREHRPLQGLQRPAPDQEDGLQGRRVHRAGVRRLPHPRRQHPRRRGRGAQQGLCADDGRARGRPGQRGRARSRDRATGARAGAQVLPGAQRRSASRSRNTRRSSSSSPTWAPRSTPRG